MYTHRCAQFGKRSSRLQDDRLPNWAHRNTFETIETPSKRSKRSEEPQQTNPPPESPPAPSEEDRIFEETRERLKQDLLLLENPVTACRPTDSSSHAPKTPGSVGSAAGRPSLAKSEERLLPPDSDNDEPLQGHIVHGQLTAGTSVTYAVDKRTLKAKSFDAPNSASDRRASKNKHLRNDRKISQNMTSRQLAPTSTGIFFYASRQVTFLV